MRTTTVWKSGNAFDSFQKEAKIEIDSNGGFNPKALLLSGLAACTGIDLVSLLEKMRVPFADLTIEAETSQTEDHPRVFRDIHLKYMIRTGEENLEKVKKAIDLSLEKYCGVAAMLKKNSKIDYTISLLADSL
jgi:putative redox protein